MAETAARAQVLGFRVRAQQLDRESGNLATTAILDIGVQDTGPDGGLWALANRGVDVAALPGNDLALVWRVRGAPHWYLRAHLRSVAAAVHPASDADAGKRIFDAAKPLKEAGVGTLAALEAVAEAMRAAVTRPMVKGEVSTELTARMSPPYLRFCRSCNTTHLYELPFRLAALQAGLELQPDTSPPVLRPIPEFRRDRGLLSPRRRPGLLAPARAGNAEARGGLSRRSGKRGQGVMARRHHGGNSRARDPMGVESRRRATR